MKINVFAFGLTCGLLIGWGFTVGGTASKFSDSVSMLERCVVIADRQDKMLSEHGLALMPSTAQSYDTGKPLMLEHRP